MKNIPSKIKQIRGELGLSQDRFGKKLGLSGKTISAYETGKSVPSCKVLKDIAIVYNAPLIGFSENRRNTINNRLEEIKNSLSELTKILEVSL